MPAAVRLDAELVRRGLARSRQRAADLIAAGRVDVAGAVATKASQPVPPDATVEVRGDDRTEYVSRAAHKLVGALDGVQTLAPGAITVTGRRCLDAGASTGGFTQVLLERGAGAVVAVDVGHGQIAQVVASDARVTSLEGVNVRALTTAETDGPVDLVVADLSFISLTVALPALLGVAAPDADLLLMVKPQFEVGRERLGSSGVVTSAELREDAVAQVARAAVRLGAVVRAVLPSPLPGPSGNHEYFLWLRPGADGAGSGEEAAEPALLDALRAAVRVAVREGRAVVVGEERS
ncbi:TlyA family RNA methyltransferase [Actinotalea fermentans]|uniref:16S/23S rRNA (Cytidine-2'-O)-methyltransferase n=1 Tax=Actinotalea fermentans TaxID=43671 RepID=A0A511YVG4_9CELL|nr:TlyA family RNA methyltransferase [Actinotalea fermentans]KGM17195.1 hypothetical protein N867_08925 [Actinotalea fermentans ATCC 43279 = JCM 9966 = DSM 3133]GEN79180.1 16S/23S rRNA (cytidine-2'-O)-methyltransferase [Actinotalea fermentans]